MSGNPDLNSYAAFFEADPEIGEQGWYHGVTFTSSHGEDKVIATVAPDEGEFEFEWHRGSQCLLKFRLIHVVRWEIQGSEALVLIVHCDDYEHTCTIHLRPTMSVEWFMDY